MNYTGQNTVNYTPASQRIASLDIIRGFALLGIVMVNSLGFNSSFFNFGGYYNSIPDTIQQQFYSIFISLSVDKFIFLFSFMFGYGIYMQYHKFISNNQNFGGFFGRRMLILSLFGVFHVLLLWAGDILFAYAIAGMVIFSLRKLSAAIQIFIALFFYFFIAMWLSAGLWVDLPDAMTSTCTECLDKARVVYSSGNYFDILQLRIQEYFAFRNNNLFYYLPKIMGVGLMGFVCSRFNLQQVVFKKKLLWTLILIIVAGIATLAYFGYEKIADFDSPYAIAVYMAGYEFMNLFMAGTYILLILLLTSFVKIANIFKPVALMGRMSLTNYLMQSLLLAIIFYGWGFGLFGQTNVILVVCIAVAIYCVQLIYSSIWFHYFNSGPLEKIWRRLTYR
ncbi:MAG: hypothetical protein CVU11_01055 [Bacteroidetes bacterium HGW-Bacteroidetes-6]|jgi:uncharacterized protein|nr:MAG: hypothetical protein CVU11_01055 [Bacteroidetes bacterium HGW-Bacteroidetes-6]